MGPGDRPDHPPQGRQGPRLPRSCWKGEGTDPQGRGWREEEKEDRPRQEEDSVRQEVCTSPPLPPLPPLLPLPPLPPSHSSLLLNPSLPSGSSTLWRPSAAGRRGPTPTPNRLSSMRPLLI